MAADITITVVFVSCLQTSLPDGAEAADVGPGRAEAAAAEGQGAGERGGRGVRSAVPLAGHGLLHDQVQLPQAVPRRQQKRKL